MNGAVTFPLPDTAGDMRDCHESKWLAAMANPDEQPGVEVAPFRFREDRPREHYPLPGAVMHPGIVGVRARTQMAQTFAVSGPK